MKHQLSTASDESFVSRGSFAGSVAVHSVAHSRVGSLGSGASAKANVMLLHGLLIWPLQAPIRSLTTPLWKDLQFGTLCSVWPPSLLHLAPRQAAQHVVVP